MKLKLDSHKMLMPTLTIACIATTMFLANSVFARGNSNEIVLVGIRDFVSVKGVEKRWYIDQERASLAVDSLKYPDQFAQVQTTFQGELGEYRFVLTSLTEIDGESEYRLSINGEEIARVVNPESSTDFTVKNLSLGTAKLTRDDVISIAFNATTNGKIPEGDSTAYSRGRWTKLSLVCVSCDNADDERSTYGD